MDTLSKPERSERMSRVRSTDTAPELFVRRIVHAMGFRYRLHDRRLPGSPDLVFPRLRRIIFVHGCFWHHHSGCGRLPKSNLSFWIPKLENNAKRDRKNLGALKKLGWQVMVVWECQLRSSRLKEKLRRFLKGGEK
ncbi:MAG: DNA mismatch endonuclease Vsr [Acidobacteriales bacterium]|nr:DNA mismatch endonuclease Vsr [Terriglobales bacterium]